MKHLVDEMRVELPFSLVARYFGVPESRLFRMWAAGILPIHPTNDYLDFNLLEVRRMRHGLHEPLLAPWRRSLEARGHSIREPEDDARADLLETALTARAGRTAPDTLDRVLTQMGEIAETLRSALHERTAESLCR